jgi:hypothetical protein
MRNPLRRKAAATSAALLGAALLVACSTSEASPVPGKPPQPDQRPATSTAAPNGPVTLKTAGERHSPGVVAAGGGDAPYNYAPAVMADGGRYRMWWCSQLGIANPPGDDILLAESGSLDGGFAGPDGMPGTPIFSGSTTGFDAVHVCDPSVIKVGGTYYMYYTGWGGEQVLGNRIGLATSPDGRVWTRSSRPVLGASREVVRDNVYGAGQPAAVYLDGWFYLMFTDTSARVAGQSGIGQFVLRAKDPGFTAGVEALAPGGFRPVPDTTARLGSVAEAFTADLMWVDALGAFAIAYEIPEGTAIIFWDKDFRTNPYQPLVLHGPWREGPGLVRRPDGHAIVAPDNPCETVPLDVVRGSREGKDGPTDLMHFGVDLVGVGACRDANTAVAVLDGFAMPSPKRTVDLVLSGKVIRIDRRSVAEALAAHFLDNRVAALDKVPVAAELLPGVPARRAAGRGVGLIIDDQLSVVPSAEVADRNSSPILDISPAAWDFYQRGPDLVPPAR